MRTIVISAIATFSFASFGYAADVGTYRPGQIYHSVPAQSPDQCAAQCLGDAQCKSWNFVQLRQNQNICEFNARHSQPISSPISISGDNPSARDSARIIPAGNRTTRIGSNSTPRFVSQQGSVTRVGTIPKYSAIPPTHAQKRRPTPRPVQNSPLVPPTIRQQPHQSIQPPTHLPQQSQIFHHSLESHQRRFPTEQRSMPIQRPNITTQHPNVTAKPKSPFAKRPAPLANQEFQSKPEPSIPAQELSSAPIASKAPKPLMPSISEIPQNVMTRSIESGLAGGPQQNRNRRKGDPLYGSLFDDVKAPKTLTAKDIPLDPDAPIPTVTSVPIERLDVQPF